LEKINYDFTIKSNCHAKEHSNLFNHKLNECGEDAYFQTFNKNLQTYFFGVADGVSGAGNEIVNPAEFSAQLCSNFKSIAESLSYPASLKRITDLATIDLTVNGASTFCGLSFNAITGKLRSFNIGDSGYIILRPKSTKLKCIFKSATQQYDFNFPYQLSKKETGEDNCKEIIRYGDSNTLQLQKGDLVIVGTDGVFDNLFTTEIINIVQPIYSNLSNIEDTQKMANEIVDLAKNPLKLNRISPWIQEANNNGKYTANLMFKPDDTTVLVSIIT
jgi:protein phosphatase PTC7